MYLGSHLNYWFNKTNFYLLNKTFTDEFYSTLLMLKFAILFNSINCQFYTLILTYFLLFSGPHKSRKRKSCGSNKQYGSSEDSASWRYNFSCSKLIGNCLTPTWNLCSFPHYLFSFLIVCFTISVGKRA